MKRGSLNVNYIWSTLAIMGIVGAILISGNITSYSERKLGQRKIENLMKTATDNNRRIEKIEDDLNAIRAEIQSLSAATDEQKIHDDVVLLDVALKRVQDRLERIERAILEDPEKVLTVQLLRGEVRELRDQQDLIRDEMLRIYDLTKTIFYVILASALSLVGFVLTSMFTRPSGTQERPGGEEASAAGTT